jgi:choline-sulfatase
VELIDINPTLCELAGLPRQPNIDGQSFAPILRSETVEHRAETVYGLRNFRGIRTRERKFAESMNDADELYNLVDDPTESRNLAEQEPARVSEMRKRMVERFMEGKWNR